jgi:dihydropteroate synthase
MRCQVWGVLNVTPDSFSDGGLYLQRNAALAHAERMLADGADVIDIGGASSRPRGQHYAGGAVFVDADEEASRVGALVAALARGLGARVSIDTTKADVARVAIDAGALIVNDVSCAASDDLLRVVAERGVEYVVMHSRGTGAIEVPNTTYRDVVTEVLAELHAAAERAVACGISRDRLWLDPGLGFAKTAAQSLALLAQTEALVASGLRVLCGPSRKGFIAEYAPSPNGERPSVSEREPGTLAAITIAVLQGASAVRVHDVRAARQAVMVADAARRQVKPC